MLSSLSGFLTFVLIGALVAVGAVAWLMMDARKAGPLAADKIVNIVREDDGGSIADQLERAGVIDSATLVQRADPARRQPQHAQARRIRVQGRHQHERHREPARVAKVVQHKLTIPEGLTSDQVVQRLRDDDVLAGEIKEVPREGSLMPDTYYFERGDTRQSILTRMAKAQTKFVDEIWKKRAADLPIKSPGEMVTLASIVEKETGKADERPRVAGVFVNRLQKHMRLESDPTIVYGLVFGKGTLGHPITRAELNQPTPYNTYLIDGLPPGPISNPGKAALEAVANPGPQQGSLLRRRRNRRPRLRRDARPAPEERRALAPDRKGRQGQARARRDAAAARPGDPRRDRIGRPRDLRRACRARPRRRPRPPPRRPPRQDRRGTAGDGGDARAASPRVSGRRSRSRSSAPSSPASTTRRPRATRSPTLTPPPGQSGRGRLGSALARDARRPEGARGEVRHGARLRRRERAAARRSPRRRRPRRRQARAGRASTTRPRGRSSIRCSTRPTI